MDLRIEHVNEQRQFEQEYAWERLSYLLTPIYNFMRDASKKPTPFTPEDFYLPSWKREEKKEVVEQEPKKELPKKWEDVLKLVEEKKERKRKLRDGEHGTG